MNLYVIFGNRALPDLFKVFPSPRILSFVRVLVVVAPGSTLLYDPIRAEIFRVSSGIKFREFPSTLSPPDEFRATVI